MMPLRNSEPEYDPRERFVLYRLCDCPICEGKGKVVQPWEVFHASEAKRCPACRGEGRQRQEVATCATPEALGVALVTLGREGEFEECPIGVLDRMPECETCGGDGRVAYLQSGTEPCGTCKGSGIKPTGTWIVKPWTPSARNVTDAARTLARSKKASQSS